MGTAGSAVADATTAVEHRAICALTDLTPERGAAALLDETINGEPHRTQIALVRVVGDTVFAVQQRDPVTGANVMARGLVGSRLVDGVEVPTLASPLHKQVYDLRTGECLDAAGKEPLPGEGGLRTWPVRVVDGVVEVGTPSVAPAAVATEGSAS
ncbi:nitrite reductase (NAD(P)H) small subunit [Serinibacter arcticus]|uniref:Nitrite reductase (NAD(P)H) small subunit n=1 Tax=Serinibacter arcticus TaxID=1655435 RepID=A0A2U2A000_9MICO|nr:nitrite reductase (NAD(P)H) small subunit [Serinibacter arcticus]